MRIEAVGGRFTASNIPLQHLVLVAYGLHGDQIFGGPEWKTSRTFDVQARSTDSVSGLDAMLPMLKALLAERFRLKVHTHTMTEGWARTSVGRLRTAPGLTGASLASLLTAATGRMVQDRTGLIGLYDWEMTYDRAVTSRAEQPPGSNTSSAVTAPPESPSLMTALQEQLGLQLKAARGTVEILVIDGAALPETD